MANIIGCKRWQESGHNCRSIDSFSTLGVGSPRSRPKHRAKQVPGRRDQAHFLTICEAKARQWRAFCWLGLSQSAALLQYGVEQRYYDPDLATFLSVDQVTAFSDPVGMFNRYRYANGSPYSFVDPNGRRACGQDTTCPLAQGESGFVLRSGSGGEKDRSDKEASAIAGKAAAEATARTAGLRRREFNGAGAAARAWFDAVLPVASRYTSEVGVRIFQGFDNGAVLGNSVTDGMSSKIAYSTLMTSRSWLSDAYPAIGYAHTHPGTSFFSGADLETARYMHSRSNQGRTGVIDFQAFVGLIDGRMYGWSVEDNKGRSDANYEYSTP